jgi:hypothetical protein
MIAKLKKKKKKNMFHSFSILDRKITKVIICAYNQPSRELFIFIDK